MNNREIHSTLLRAFAALPRADRVRLAWHAKRGTPVCCGRSWFNFIDQNGGG